jgi:hypothetical protein
VDRALEEDDKKRMAEATWVFDGQVRRFNEIVGRRKKKKDFEYEVQWQVRRWRGALLSRGRSGHGKQANPGIGGSHVLGQEGVAEADTWDNPFRAAPFTPLWSTPSPQGLSSIKYNRWIPRAELIEKGFQKKVQGAGRRKGTVAQAQGPQGAGTRLPSAQRPTAPTVPPLPPAPPAARSTSTTRRRPPPRSAPTCGRSTAPASRSSWRTLGWSPSSRATPTSAGSRVCEGVLDRRVTRAGALLSGAPEAGLRLQRPKFPAACLVCRGPHAPRHAGGQKVKLVLAAAMWNSPHLLIMDEPTNYLDRWGGRGAWGAWGAWGAGGPGRRAWGTRGRRPRRAGLGWPLLAPLIRCTHPPRRQGLAWRARDGDPGV